MFGFAKPPCSCARTRTADYLQHRGHYCGVCKTMGTLFGHSSRFFLNFDAVFLAELLSFLQNDKVVQWSNSLKAINQCFVMPKQENEIPMALQYAATVNLILVELKLQDKIIDHKSTTAYLGKWWFKPSVHRALQKLEQWNINASFIRELTAQQSELEQAKVQDFETLEAYLKHLAQATANLTAYLFQQAAMVLNIQEHSKTLYQFGYVFGEFMYVLDAFQDIEKDKVEQQFNPFIQWNKTCLLENNVLIELARNLVLAYQSPLASALQALNLETAFYKLLNNRIQSNLVLAAYQQRFVPLTRKQRWQKRFHNIGTQIQQASVFKPHFYKQLGKYVASFLGLTFPLFWLELDAAVRSAIWFWILVLTAILYATARVKKPVLQGLNWVLFSDKPSRKKQYWYPENDPEISGKKEEEKEEPEEPKKMSSDACLCIGGCSTASLLVVFGAFWCSIRNSCEKESSQCCSQCCHNSMSSCECCKYGGNC